MSSPAVFLDRDGTVIVDQDYLRDPELVEAIPGALQSLLALQDAGYLLFIVSNQSGVGRGIISDDQFLAVHNRFDQILRDVGVRIQEYGYCLHRPDEKCRCRKPETGLVDHMTKRHSVDLARSYVVGDKISDVELGHRVGANAVLVLTGKGAETQTESSYSQSYRVLSSAAQLAASILSPTQNADRAN